MDAPVVFLSEASRRHVMLRRGISSADALVAISWLEHVVAQPEVGGIDPRDPQRALVVASIPGEPRDLAVALKWVPPSTTLSGTHEFWITTALCLGRAKLRRYQRVGRLRALNTPTGAWP